MKQHENYASGGSAVSTWVEQLNARMAPAAAGLCAEAFPAGYQYDFSVDDAVADIEMLAALGNGCEIAMRLYRDAADNSAVLRLRLARSGEQIALSDVLPLLENFGLRVLGEHPYTLTSAVGETVTLHVFELEYASSTAQSDAEFAALAERFEQAFLQVWNGAVESDSFNRLILTGVADWRQVTMLRAYSKYMKQINLPYTRLYTAATLAKYPQITAQLTDWFEQRFAPQGGASTEQRQAACTAIETKLVAALDSVENLTEDLIIRQYLTLLRATLRTNYYQPAASGDSRSYLSFKFDVNAIPETPKPRPLYEIFVYSPEFEGVHLRGGKVARGGLRWSDRHEDFRTEVLGLVKAQQVKNSVIVPMGAKGGFVCKRAPAASDREAFLANGIACYRQFISALLELTDNLVDSQVVPPAAVVRWDSDDTYLVVAADKGTATFSDIANEISEAHGFWLGDAFASGGSVGYDHKKMGITAKGAWVSVQRHFREMGVNVQREDFSVVAVGDMAGDVFGNGMLCSKHICLLAAFNHQHIFLDPNPDAAASFVERERLFNAPGTNWADYNAALISNGGGIFSRSAKSIPISAQVKARFAIDSDELAPNDLIKALLKAEVDLFWNGGIGTYAKARSETHAQVGDRANDSVRVDACEFGAKVIGEGGNLGITQLARVEYALHGGRCNTDFIDNAGGVDCSDHEVNIKILLNALTVSGELEPSARNELLYAMTDAVGELVLHNNYRQTQAISLAEAEATMRSVEHRRLINQLESQGMLDRELEFIPADEELAERKAYGKALTRPELSVLVSYAKLALKQALANGDLALDSYVAASAYGAFPARLQDEFAEHIDQHRLHNEIVATQVASDMVNRMGITFVHRMQQATGESETHIAKAYVACRDLFGIEARWQQIEALDDAIDCELQQELFSQLTRLVRRSTRWLLRKRRAQLDPATDIETFRDAANFMQSNIGTLLGGGQLDAWQEKGASYSEAGVPQELAEFVAGARYYFNTFSIADVVAQTGSDPARVSACYFAMGEKLELNWFADQIMEMGVENYWQAMARESFRDELEGQQASLVASLIANSSEADEQASLASWMDKHRAYIERWQTMTAELRCVEEFDLAMFPVAIRELLDLSQASQKAA